MDKEYFLTLADYHAWANTTVFNACRNLSEDNYLKDRGAFFTSIHGTLNHTLLCDRLWLGRLTGQRPKDITTLDQILYDNLDDLAEAQKVQDSLTANFIENLTDDDLADTLAYRTISGGGKEMETPVVLVLAQFFNHGTHHRGQVHNMLSQAGITPPPLDIIFYLRD